jgi:hypothetical protein
MGQEQSTDAINHTITKVMLMTSAEPSGTTQNVTIIGLPDGYIISQRYSGAELQQSLSRMHAQLDTQCRHNWMAHRTECRDCYTQRRLGYSWADLAWRKKIARLRPAVLTHERELRG